jgi:hypothetical protein
MIKMEKTIQNNRNRIAISEDLKNKGKGKFVKSLVSAFMMSAMAVYVEDIYARITNATTRAQAVAAVNSRDNGADRAALARHVQPHFFINSQLDVVRLHKDTTHTTFDWQTADIVFLTRILDALRGGVGDFQPRDNAFAYRVTFSDFEPYIRGNHFTWHIKEWPRTYRIDGGVINNRAPERNHERDATHDIGPATAEALDHKGCRHSEVVLHVNFNAGTDRIANGTFFITYHP